VSPSFVFEPLASKAPGKMSATKNSVSMDIGNASAESDLAFLLSPASPQTAVAKVCVCHYIH